MSEVPNAYRCDYCRALMEPIEHKDARWHTKWCSKCGTKLYDVFLGGSLDLSSLLPLSDD